MFKILPKLQERYYAVKLKKNLFGEYMFLHGLQGQFSGT